MTKPNSNHNSEDIAAKEITAQCSCHCSLPAIESLTKRVLIMQRSLTRVTRAMAGQHGDENFAKALLRVTMEEKNMALEIALYQLGCIEKLKAPPLICRAKEDEIETIHAELASLRSKDSQDFINDVDETARKEVKNILFEMLCHFVGSELPISMVDGDDLLKLLRG